MKLAISGSRAIPDDHHHAQIIEHAIMSVVRKSALLIPKDERHGFTVIHGACPTGADAIADRICRAHGVDVEKTPADWSLGRKAGPLRNQKLAEQCDHALLFFKAGEPNKGTLSMQKCLTRLKKPFTIHNL